MGPARSARVPHSASSTPSARTEEGEQEILREEQADHTPWSRPHRKPHAYLALPRRRVREHQGGGVPHKLQEAAVA